MNEHAKTAAFNRWLKAGAVWAALSLALAATVAGAYLDIGNWKLPLALSIASLKAGLVIVFFMELVRASSASRVAILAGALWLALLISFVLADLGTRPRLPPEFDAASPDLSTPR